MRSPYSPALLLAVWWVGVGSVRAEPPGTPIIEAKDGVTIQADDAGTLTRLAAKRGKGVWLIRLAVAQMVRPPARSCEVYLKPEARSERLRRGELRRGTCFEQPDGKTRWQLGERVQAYAWVSPPGQSFGSGGKPPGAADGLFAITGRISDRDLVQAVDLVRAQTPPEASPTPEVSRVENADGSVEEIIGPTKRSFHMSIDHELPISRLEAKDADHVEISTSTGHGSGQQIDLQRENARWKIVQVWQWNA